MCGRIERFALREIALCHLVDPGGPWPSIGREDFKRPLGGSGRLFLLLAEQIGDFGQLTGLAVHLVQLVHFGQRFIVPDDAEEAIPRIVVSASDGALVGDEPGDSLQDGLRLLLSLGVTIAVASDAAPAPAPAVRWSRQAAGCHRRMIANPGVPIHDFSTGPR